MRKRTKWILGVVLAAVGAGGVAGFALPGPQQALWPKLAGLHEISTGIYIDDLEQADASLAIINEARRILTGFYPEPQATPRIILCSHPDCSAIFLGERTPERTPRGITYGEHVVLVTPKGINPMILSHELAHAELHRLFTLSDIYKIRFPSWFNEGLSGWISQDDRLTAPDAAARARIQQAWRVRDWGVATKEMGWREAYGAAQAIVADMVKTGGTDALHTLINRVANGEAFEDVRSELFP